MPDVHSPDVVRGPLDLERVDSTAPRTGEVRDYQPFYALRHGGEERGTRPSGTRCGAPSRREGDGGTDVFLTLVDRGFRRPSTRAGAS